MHRVTTARLRPATTPRFRALPAVPRVEARVVVALQRPLQVVEVPQREEGERPPLPEAGVPQVLPRTRPSTTGAAQRALRQWAPGVVKRSQAAQPARRECPERERPAA